MKSNKRRVVLAVAAMVVTFTAMRISLYLSPNSNLDIGPYNIHHLFTGLLLITGAAFPLILGHGASRLLDLAAIVFGAGLSMALDEWVYLIVTDGSDASYLLPVSFWGGVVMISLAAVYALTLVALARRNDDSGAGTDRDA